MVVMETPLLRDIWLNLVFLRLLQQTLDPVTPTDAGSDDKSCSEQVGMRQGQLWLAMQPFVLFLAVQFGNKSTGWLGSHRVVEVKVYICIKAPAVAGTLEPMN